MGADVKRDVAWFLVLLLLATAGSLEYGGNQTQVSYLDGGR
jgi:hypothetical protein